MESKKAKHQVTDVQPGTDVEAAGRGEVDADNESGHPVKGTRVSRRQLLKSTAATTVAVRLLGLGEVLAQKGKRRDGGVIKRPRFFTVTEFAMLDDLTEMIIPTDEHSPGARAAGVAVYLDRRIAETNPKIVEQAKERKTWREGLGLVEKISQEMYGKGYMEGTGEQRLAVLTRMAEQEPRPKPIREPIPSRPEEQPQQQPQGKPAETDSARKSEGEFFAFLKAQTARAYYTSQIGLRKELEYKGNQYLKEFVGYDVNGNYTEPPKSK
jgi:hypothetical protein